MLDSSEVQKLAKLSRLEVTGDEAEVLRGRLDQMLEYMDELRALDLSEVEPMTCVEEHSGQLRPDVPQTSLSQELAFGNAPRVDQGHFVIPKVIG